MAKAKKSYNRGNKSAEKYTEENTVELFEQALTILISDKSILTESYLKVLCKQKIKLPISTYDYLLNKKFKNLLEDIKKEIDAILEHRVINARHIHAGIAAMTLKNKHGWTDKNETSIPELEGMSRALAEAAKRANG